MGLTVLMGGAAGDGGGDLAAALEQVDRAVDTEAAIPFADLSLAEQARAAPAMVRLRSRLESVEAAAVRAFDTGGEWALDGHRSGAAALTHLCRLPRAEARRRVRLARRLQATPAVAAALAAGDIISEHAEDQPDQPREPPLHRRPARSARGPGPHLHPSGL